MALKVEHDPINHPSYYTNSDTGIECIEAIRASMSLVEYCGWLKGTIEKYVWRYKNKEDPIKDLKKARFFINELIKVLEEEEVY